MGLVGNFLCIALFGCELPGSSTNSVAKLLPVSGMQCCPLMTTLCSVVALYLYRINPSLHLIKV